jgi:hypothetical protein
MPKCRELEITTAINTCAGASEICISGTKMKAPNFRGLFVLEFTAKMESIIITFHTIIQLSPLSGSDIIRTISASADTRNNGCFVLVAI